MDETKPRKPMSARKRAAIMANLAKARAAPRSPESRARSSRNATKHGLFVQNFEESVRRLGEDQRQFLRLGGLLARVFLPRDATEWRLVRKLAEAAWRHFRVYRAVPGWMQAELGRQLPVVRGLADFERGRLPRGAPEVPVRATQHAALEMMAVLTYERRLERRQRLTLNEIERTLRLLLIYRSGNLKFKFHFSGRRYKNEFTELSEDPRNWPRRYAAAVPMK
jgi:hypothetical protein